MHDEPENFPTADTRCWEPKQNICKGNGSVEWGEGGGYALLEDWRISISLCFGAPDHTSRYHYSIIMYVRTLFRARSLSSWVCMGPSMREGLDLNGALRPSKGKANADNATGHDA